MLEFGARILLAGAVVALAGATGLCGLPLAIGVALAVVALAFAAYALDERGLYDGSGAGLHAGLEALAVSLLLVDAGRAEALGFFALIPYAWASARRRAPWSAGAFAVWFALVGAHAIVHGAEPPPGLLFQAGGALALGLLLACRAVPEDVPIAESAGAEIGELRARFRALRAAYDVLEDRSTIDAHAAALARATTPDAMAQSLRDATSATGAALFAPTDEGWQAVGRAGTVPEEFDGSFRTGRQLQEQGAILLFSAGKPVGAAWVPDEARDGITAIADTLSTRLADRMEAEAERRRRRVAELRMVLVEGGDSPDAVARAVAALVGADSVEFGTLGPQGATTLGRYGPPCGLPEALRHASGPGLKGWAAAGTPLVWISDARQDGRLDGMDALRARASSLALLPLNDGRAYAWAAWHASGIGRPSALTTMRAAEPTVLRWLEPRTARRNRLAA